MKKSTLTFSQALENAKSAGLTIGEHCTELSGYPRTSENKPITGFNKYSDAVAFIAKNRLVKSNIHLFKRKNGWYSTFLYDLGSKYEPLTYHDYLKDLGDDYSIASLDYELLKEQVCYALNKKELYEAKEIISNFQDLEGYIISCEKENVIITRGGEYYQEFPKETMGYTEDVTTYIIGVMLDPNDFKSEEE
jgi:hypothetical protein